MEIFDHVEGDFVKGIQPFHPLLGSLICLLSSGIKVTILQVVIHMLENALLNFWVVRVATGFVRTACGVIARRVVVV